jgi:tRNA(Leu) C34 or U34 (ribose-2'-O)-methylase TrmL
MKKVHLPKPIDTKTGAQECSRCGIELHRISPNAFRDNPKEMAAAALSVDNEFAFNPLAIFEKNVASLPEGFERCKPSAPAAEAKKNA